VHRRPRIAYSHRIAQIQASIDTCDAALRHIEPCENCTESDLCPVGQELYDAFLVANSRAKLLTADTD
jgi:hypothetical protein